MVMHIERAQLDELLERIPDTIDFDLDEAEPCRDLGEWLEHALRVELGLVCVARDAVGDIPVTLGDNVIHVRQRSDDQFVTVWAQVLEDFEVTPEVYQAVNAVNVQTPLAKAVVDTDENRIVVLADLEVVDTLSPQDLVLAVEIVDEAVRQFGSRLQRRFGSVNA